MEKILECLASRQRRTTNPKNLAWLAIAALLFQVLSAAILPVTSYAASPPTIVAPTAIAIDAGTGRILFSKDPHRRTAMASTTKIMTALTARSIPDVDLNDRYTVVRADMVGEASMRLSEGDVVTFEDLLYGMLINSGNDAATAIARYAGSKLPGTGDPVARFVAQMNKKAAELGLRDSHYANPHGLDQNGHYSSAFDLAITGWYLLQDPLLSKIVTVQYGERGGKELRNLNKFLLNYNGANGIKPGETDNAGLCLVSSATRNKQTVITVVLNDDAAGYNTDPIKLSDYAFALLNEPASMSAGGGPGKVDYIGKVSGNKLVVEAVAGQSTNPLQVEGDNAVANPMAVAQVVTTLPVTGTVSTRPVTTSTPDLTAQPGSNSSQTSSTPGSEDSESSKKGNGGLNFFGIFLLLIAVMLIVWLLARMGLIMGARGRNMALLVQDRVVIIGKTGGHFLKRLLINLRPGNHDEAEKPAHKLGGSRGIPAQTNRTQAASYRNRVEGTTATPAQPEPTNPRPKADRPSVTPMINTKPDNTTRRPGPDYTFTDNRTASTRPGILQNSQPVNNRVNPLENFFDDDEMPALQDEIKTSSSPVEDVATPRPPSPLGPRPTTSNPVHHPNRTAAEPQQKPPEVYRPRPVSPPVMPRPLTSNNPPAAPSSNPYSSQPAASNGVENVNMRARQAIDYAYAGRLQASTDEFRKVVENNPLFDFGQFDEFEQMPVIGFKALAGAYHQCGKTQFALLLLDMAVDKYPNDLELRNLYRSLRRENEI